MKPSIWLICTLTSFVPSACLSSTSEYFFASATAPLVMAPIQPWSAWGAEKPMTTLSPGSSFPVVPPGSTVALGASLVGSSSGVFDVQPARTRVKAAAVPAMVSQRRRRGAADMTILLDQVLLD